MARKKTEKPEMPATEVQEDLKLVRLQLPASVHKKFRILAAQDETTMAILARKVVVEYVERATKGGSR